MPAAHRRTTIKQVAKAANVSVAAASMALNNKPGVSEKTRQHILQIAKELQYFTNETAKTLKTQKSRCLGLIVTDIGNPFFSMLVAEFSHRVEANGYSVLLGISGDSSAKEAEYTRMFISKGVEGMIIVPAVEENRNVEHLAFLQELKIPFVFCTSFDEGIEAPCVMTELTRGEYNAVRHLLEQGCRRIFFLAAHEHAPPTKFRLQGYAQAYQDMGLAYDPAWIFHSAPDFQNGYNLAQEMWKLRPDAIATINDFLAMGVMKRLKEMQVRIPQDVSILGYDDLLFSSLLETPLTTVRQPVRDICQKALEVLLHSIGGGHEEKNIIFLDPVLKIRQSTK